MTRSRIATVATVFTALIAAFIIFIGIRFILDPHAAVAGFGIAGPQGAGSGFYDIKGVRDITSGLVPLTLLITGRRRALGWVVLAEAFTPIGDATIVLTHGGSVATALGIHAATAAFLLLTAGLLLHETRQTAAGTAIQPAAEAA